MGSKNQQYNQWLKDQKKYGKSGAGSFEDYQKNVSGGGKVKLGADYTNWWDVAGDVYGGKAGQRAYAVLKEANPGIDRFYRGMTIKVPRIDTSRVRLTDEQVARERGEWDYDNNRPTQDYFNARDQVGQPEGTQVTGTGFPAPLYPGEENSPVALSPSVLQLSTGARIYAPYPWQNATPGGAVGSMGGITPTLGPLQQFFYGSSANTPRVTPNTPPRSLPTPAVPTPLVPQQPRYAQNQARQTPTFGQARQTPNFGMQPLPPVVQQAMLGQQSPARQTPDLFGLPPAVQQAMLREQGTQGTARGDARQTPTISEDTWAQVRQVAEQEQWAMRDHTWLEPWMKTNLPSAIGGGAPTAAEIEALPRDVQEMLFVLGIIEPEFSTGAPDASTRTDFSTGEGRIPYRPYGGRRTSSARTGGSYTRPVYPGGGGGRSAYDYTNLVKWNI